MVNITCMNSPGIEVLTYGTDLEIHRKPIYDKEGGLVGMGELAMFARIRLVPLRDHLGHVFCLGQLPNN